MSAQEGWWCCMRFLNRLLREATSNFFGLIFIICHDFLQKPQQDYLVLKWSVCIGVCFSVYMVYSLMACLNYITSVLCIVCLFFYVRILDEMVRKSGLLS